MTYRRGEGRPTMQGRRTITIAMGIFWILGLLLLFIRPEIALLCFFAAGMFALYLWLLGKQSEIQEVRWQREQAHRIELLAGLEADGVITAEECAERRAGDGGLRHPDPRPVSVDEVRRVGNRRLWLAGVLLIFGGLALFLLAPTLGASVMVGGLVVTIWSILAGRDAQTLMRRQVARSTSDATVDRWALWDDRAAALRTLQRERDGGRLAADEYERRRAALLGDL